MRRVLVVDDQSFVRAATMAVLRLHGFDSVGFESGIKALAAAQESWFDLAVVDIYMPGMDGVQLIKTLRQRVPNFPIVAMSGTTLPGSKRTALDYFSELPALAGITRLKKPFRPPELLEAIQTAMSIAA